MLSTARARDGGKLLPHDRSIRGEKMNASTAPKVHFQRRRQGVATVLIPILIAPAADRVLGHRTAMGCSVPVFRYALEHWTPEDYEVFVSDTLAITLAPTANAPLRETVLSGVEVVQVE